MKKKSIYGYTISNNVKLFLEIKKENTMKEQTYYLLKNLEIGDVILTNNINTASIIKSKAQKAYTKGHYTHAMMYVTDNTIIESTSSTGVRFQSSNKLAFSDIKNIKILRYKEKIAFTNLFTEGLNRYAFMKYNIEGIKAFTSIGESNSNKVFCSELVANIYNDYNIKLFDIPLSKITPETFENSSKFDDITKDCTYTIKNLPERITYICDKDILLKTDSLELQEKSIAKMNKKVTTKYREIHNLQIAYELIGNYYIYAYTGIHLKLIENVKNNNLQLIDKTSDRYIKSIYTVLYEIIKNRNINSQNELKKFIIQLDEYLNKVLANHKYYDSHNNFINAHKNITIYNKLDDYNTDKIDGILSRLKKEKESYEMIYYSHKKELESLKINQGFKEFKVISNHFKNLGKINLEFKMVLTKINKNIEILQSYINSINK